MAKTITWVSLMGGLFEGTAAQLCREMNVKHRQALARPTGAPDEEGDRWMSKEQFEALGFKKPSLYLHDLAGSNSTIYLNVRNDLSKIDEMDAEHREFLEGIMSAYENVFDIVDSATVDPSMDPAHLIFLEKKMKESKSAFNKLQVAKQWAGKFHYPEWTVELEEELQETKSTSLSYYHSSQTEKTRIDRLKEDKLKLNGAAWVANWSNWFKEKNKVEANGILMSIEQIEALCTKLSFTPPGWRDEVRKYRYKTPKLNTEMETV